MYLPITPNNILKSLEKLGYSKYDIFKYYCSNIDSKKFFSIRNETKPSAKLFTINGELYVKDFGEATFNWINFIKYIENYPDNKEGYKMVLLKVINDFNLREYNTSTLKVNVLKSNKIPQKHDIIIENNKECIIRYRSRNWWNKEIDVKLWITPYNLDAEDVKLLNNELIRYQIKPLTHYWINDILFTVKESNPTYTYCIDRKVKLYTPLSEDFKWISNVPNTKIFGYKQLPEKGDLLIIEKSLKDTIYMNLLEYTTLPLNGEAMFMTDELYNDLKERFTTIIYHPDNDKAGIKAGMKFKEKYNLDYFINPEASPKDTTDYWIKNGKEETKRMMFNEINNKLCKKQ